MQRHGDGYAASPGLTREETAFRDPYGFYEHAVRSLLAENELEKVRLLGKLMAKYRGRERHRIHKLGARYEGGNKCAAAAASSPVDEAPSTPIPAAGRSSPSGHTRWQVLPVR